MGVSLLTGVSEDRRLWRTFRHHSRTFSLAARLLPRTLQLPIATLYLFCRTVDTIADRRVLDVGAEAALDEVYALKARLNATLAGHPPDEFLWLRLQNVHERFGLRPGPLYELIDGAIWDLEGRGIEDRADLVAYSGLVGGSVGAMLLPFLVAGPADDARLEAPARALGIAMQITNIMRDVGEDYRQLGRVYLPRLWMTEHGLSAEDLARPDPPPAYPLLLEAAMETAEAFYRQSFGGIDALPANVRVGIRSAARMYREIMNEVRARRYDNLNHRAYVPLRRKLSRVVHDGYDRRKARLCAQHAYAAG